MYRYSSDEWRIAKNEAKAALIVRARTRGMMAYSELVKRIEAIELDAHDPRLFQLLCEISEDENAEGRGLISALVVHKQGDMQPGTGFFDLAKRLGRDTSDVLECWMAEVKKVHRSWQPDDD